MNVSAKQIAVRPRALEDNGFIFEFIDEQPVRLNMAFLIAMFAAAFFPLSRAAGAAVNRLPRK